ncbi:MAG: SurA N-terminal domain-containing protein [bacterium]
MNKKMLRDIIILIVIFVVAFAAYQLYSGKKKTGIDAPLPSSPQTATPASPAAPGARQQPSMEDMVLLTKKKDAIQKWLVDVRAKSKIEKETDLTKTTGYVAVINGEEISAQEFQKRAKVRERMGMSSASPHGTGAAATGETEKKKMLEELLEKMINEVLLQQEARKLKIEVTDAEIDRMLREKKTTFPSESEFEATLTSHGFTVDDIRAQLSRELLQEKVEEALTSDVKVTEDDLKMFRTSETEIK